MCVGPGELEETLGQSALPCAGGSGQPGAPASQRRARQECSLSRHECQLQAQQAPWSPAARQQGRRCSRSTWEAPCKFARRARGCCVLVSDAFKQAVVFKFAAVFIQPHQRFIDSWAYVRRFCANGRKRFLHVVRVWRAGLGSLALCDGEQTAGECARRWRGRHSAAQSRRWRTVRRQQVHVTPARILSTAAVSLAPHCTNSSPRLWVLRSRICCCVCLSVRALAPPPRSRRPHTFSPQSVFQRRGRFLDLLVLPTAR